MADEKKKRSATVPDYRLDPYAERVSAEQLRELPEKLDRIIAVGARMAADLMRRRDFD